MISDYFSRPEDLYDILDFVCEDDVKSLWDGKLENPQVELELLAKFVGITIEQLIAK